MADDPELGSSTPPDSRYHEHSFWQERYEGEDPAATFEWYHGYDGALRDLVLGEAAREAPTLLIGSGNSEMPERMIADGFRDVVATDYVSGVVDRMRARCAGLAGLRFEVQDARELTYPDASFGTVIDKGTLDAADMGRTNVPRICREAARVLSRGGVFLVFSVQPPFSRIPYLKRPAYGWDVRTTAFSHPVSGMPLHAFVMRKAAG